MDFSVSHKEREYVDKVKRFIIEKVKPYISEWYRKQSFPLSFFNDLYKAGLSGFYKVEHKWEMETMSHSIILYEKLAEISPGLAVSLMAHSQMGLYALYRWGNVWQKGELMLPGVMGNKLICFANTEMNAGSDSGNIKLTAKKVSDGYILNGEKLYILNGYNADIILVTAITDPFESHKKGRITIFSVDANSDGLGKINLKTSTLIPSNLAKLTFKDCFVPAENIIGELNRGFHIMMKILTSSRIILSALTLGTAMGAYKLALSRACKRNVFEIPILDHQAKSFEFAEKLTRLETSRLITKKAAWMRDMGQKYTLSSSMARYSTMEIAKDIIIWAGEIMGGGSVLSDSYVNKYSLDLPGLLMAGGTIDIQKLIIFRFIHLWDNWDNEFNYW